MAHQQLNGAHVSPGFEEVGCETVPKRMGCDRFGNAASSMGFLAGLTHRLPGNVAAGKITPEEPLLGLFYRPPGA